MNTAIQQQPRQSIRIVGTCVTEGGKFFVRSPYNASHLTFFKMLPHSSFSKPKSAWVCAATPFAAFKLVEVGLSLDEDAKQLAESWAVGQLPPKIGEIVDMLNQFKTQPWQHQQRAMAFAINKPASLLGLEMGCGKTLATICLLQAWKSRLNLILCPKSVTGVWRREFAKHCGLSHRVTILEGSSKEKAYQASQAILVSRSYAISAVVVNYESSWREHIGDILQDTIWDCVVCDESHRIKTMSSVQSKFASTLASTSRRRLALTGTVMPNGEPIEVLAQYRFLEPALFGTTQTRFQDAYCNMSAKVPGKVDSYKNTDKFTEIFSKIAFRVQSKDVLKLPDSVHITIPVTLGKKTRDYYEKMKREALIELEAGDVTAKNAAIKVMRLHQIACGHSKTEETQGPNGRMIPGEIIRLGNEKQEVLEDMISDIPMSEPVVVFCQFKEDIRQVEEVAKKLGRVYGEISGARKDITENALMPDHVQLMAVQQRAGGTGIDLTRARYAFWFSAGSSWGEFDQTNARVHRPGQEKNVFFYHLAATATVDIKIYRSLRNKQDIGLELLKSIDHKDEDE